MHTRDRTKWTYHPIVEAVFSIDRLSTRGTPSRRATDAARSRESAGQASAAPAAGGSSPEFRRRGHERLIARARVRAAMSRLQPATADAATLQQWSNSPGAGTRARRGARRRSCNCAAWGGRGGVPGRLVATRVAPRARGQAALAGRRSRGDDVTQAPLLEWFPGSRAIRHGPENAPPSRSRVGARSDRGMSPRMPTKGRRREREPSERARRSALTAPHLQTRLSLAPLFHDTASPDPARAPAHTHHIRR